MQLRPCCSVHDVAGEMKKVCRLFIFRLALSGLRLRVLFKRNGSSSSIGQIPGPTIMHGLVGYGSSSEEEDEVSLATKLEEDASSNHITHATKHLNNGDEDVVDLHQDQGQEATVTTQGPMVGPSMPMDTLSTLEEYEEDDMLTDLPPMSEGDLLRHLTQPSHPISSLPPEPDLQADPAVTAKFKRFLELKKKGIHFNEDLANKSSFKNPSLFASLLERTGLPPEAQYASSLPSDVFSLDLFPPWAHKDALLKSQQAIDAQDQTTKKAQSAAGKRTVQFTSARQVTAESRESTPGVQGKRKRP